MEGEVQPGSVLLSDQIKRYVEEFDLIEPFNPGNLKPASYQLSVGDEYAIGGELKKLKGKGDKIEIHPFNVAIIQTNEKVKMPKDLIARWNIRVTLAYQGLLWVGGPQVDPGYEGHLYCPIYNLSKDTVKLSQYEKIATIDFTKTTPYNEKDVVPFARKRNDVITEYNYTLQSGLFTEVAQRIDEIAESTSTDIQDLKKMFSEQTRENEKKLDESIQEIRSRSDAFMFTTITFIGIILTVISVLIVFSSGHDFSAPVIALTSSVISFIALMGVIYLYSKRTS